MRLRPTGKMCGKTALRTLREFLDSHAHSAGAKRQFANGAKGHKALIAWSRQWPDERIAY